MNKRTMSALAVAAVAVGVVAITAVIAWRRPPAVVPGAPEQVTPRADIAPLALAELAKILDGLSPEQQRDELERRLGPPRELPGSNLRYLAWDFAGGRIVFDPIEGATFSVGEDPPFRPGPDIAFVEHPPTVDSVIHGEYRLTSLLDKSVTGSLHLHADGTYSYDPVVADPLVAHFFAGNPRGIFQVKYFGTFAGTRTLRAMRPDEAFGEVRFQAEGGKATLRLVVGRGTIRLVGRGVPGDDVTKGW